MKYYEVNQKIRFKLWLQWIAANAMGELLGLGIVGVIAFFIASKFTVEHYQD